MAIYRQADRMIYMTVLLTDFEKHIYSQFNEDGITNKIFEVIGTTNKVYLDFGATETMNNSEFLHKHQGWTGTLWNGKSFTNGYTPIHKEYITSENVVSLCKKYDVPEELDLLSIDIDGNDWHVWREISKAIKPRVVLIEYNSAFPPGDDRVMPYNPEWAWDGYNYYGATITAMYNLGRHLGYSLVSAEGYGGVNLFFVRDDIHPEKYFKGVNDVEFLYRPPHFGTSYPYTNPPYGHPHDFRNRPWETSVNLLT
jgi:hypothetical protein